MLLAARIPQKVFDRDMKFTGTALIECMILRDISLLSDTVSIHTSSLTVQLESSQS